MSIFVLQLQDYPLPTFPIYSTKHIRSTVYMIRTERKNHETQTIRGAKILFLSIEIYNSIPGKIVSR